MKLTIGNLQQEFTMMNRESKLRVHRRGCRHRVKPPVQNVVNTRMVQGF